MKFALLLIIVATAESKVVEEKCETRRCLAQTLLNRNLLTQPQSENCTLEISVPFIEYQTLEVDTKSLRLHSRLLATVDWIDPELAWNDSLSTYDVAVLPVDKVWTPELRVTNGLSTQMKHSSPDLTVRRDGSVTHTVEILAEIGCEVNLFNYPFAFDECPVAIQTFNDYECGASLHLHYVWSIDGSAGDWKTESANLDNMGFDRNYILVSLSISPGNPFLTLMLPTILIFIADIVSFALPLGGGERNSFKVTLVLSFIMFLILLNSELPGDGKCSPVIRIHFCICLILLVLSMLVSMLMTRVAQDGQLLFRCWSKSNQIEEQVDEEADVDSKRAEQNAPEDTQILRNVFKFLQDFKSKEEESERFRKVADKWDKIYFWFYFVGGTTYICTMFVVMKEYKCVINHFDFWYTFP